VSNHSDLMGDILNILLVRRACDKVYGDGIDAPWLASHLAHIPSITFVFPTKRELARFSEKGVLTVGDINRLMKLNYEKTDYCSRAMKQAIDKCTTDNKFLHFYMTARCTGRGFVDIAADVGIRGSTVKDILSWAWDDMEKSDVCNPEDMFSNGLAPQTKHRYFVKAMSKETFLTQSTLRQTFGIELKPKKVHLKKSDGSFRTKRDVMADLRNMPGAGPFVAKNMWRVMNRYRPSVLPDDSNYADSGSGARSFMLLCQGLPPRFGITCVSQAACDTFNIYLQRFMHDLNNLLARRIRQATCDREVFGLRQ